MAAFEKMVNVGAQLPQKKAQMLARLAAANERSVAAEIRIAIDKHLGLLHGKKP